MNTLPKIIMSQITFKDCWTWNGGKDADGYGRVFIDGKYKKVSRLTYEAFFGQKPKFKLRKTCADRACVNPAHTLQHQLITGEDIIKLGELLHEKSKERTD